MTIIFRSQTKNENTEQKVILASFITFNSDLSLILTMAKNTSLNRQSYIDRFPLPSAESSKEKLLEMLKHRPCVCTFGFWCFWDLFMVHFLSFSNWKYPLVSSAILFEPWGRRVVTMETVIFTCGISNYAEIPLLSINQIAEIFQIVV